jgi:hypothetical protein
MEASPAATLAGSVYTGEMHASGSCNNPVCAMRNARFLIVSDYANYL